MTMVKRIAVDRGWGLIIDVQEFFLSQIDTSLRSKLETNIENFARLLGYFRVPMVATLERPVDQKGALPSEIAKHVSGNAKILEKDFFDLTKEKDCGSHCAPEKEAGHRGRLRNRCLRPAVLPRPSRSWLRRLRGGGARIFLIAERRRGDRQNEGRRRRVPDVQEPLLRADRGGGRLPPWRESPCGLRPFSWLEQVGLAAATPAPSGLASILRERPRARPGQDRVHDRERKQ